MRELIDRIVDVVIPISRREEVVSCILSLLKSKELVRRILICEGSFSSQPYHSSEVFRDPRVRLIRHPLEHFNKSTLINQGLRESSGPLVLVSDADILWNNDTIVSLVEHCRKSKAFMYVRRVLETDEKSSDIVRARLRPAITRDGSRYIVRIENDSCLPSERPGCGLVMAKRQSWHEVGGMKECYSSWGWEDLDLLARAKILGFKIDCIGQVCHMSHGDEKRNLFPRTTVESSRSANIVTFLKEVRAGRIWGDIATTGRKLDAIFEVEDIHGFE